MENLDPEKVEQLLDVVGNKLGETLVAAQPLTEVLLHEYVVRHAFGAFGCFVVVLAAVIICLKVYPKLIKMEDETDRILALVFFSGAAGVTLILFWSVGMDNLVRALSPHISILLDLAK